MAGRIREKDLIIPALRAAAESRNGQITTSRLIEELSEEFAPEGRDAEIIDGRNDSFFSQKVRNLISHRNTATSMFQRGYAEYDAGDESIRITDIGRAFLDQVPDE